MKNLLSFFSIVILFSCCSMSHNTVSQQAKNKIESLGRFINLTDEQVLKLEQIESKYLSKKDELTDSRNLSDIKKLDRKRIDAYKKILTRRQFNQFKAIEHKLFDRDVPIRS